MPHVLLLCSWRLQTYSYLCFVIQYHKMDAIIAIRVTRIVCQWRVLNSATADLTSLMGKYRLTYELESEYLAK